MRTVLISVLLVVLGVSQALASSIPFDRAWREQGFLRLFTNDYTLGGDRLGVVSDGTVSLLWRPVEPSLRTATRARWHWAVSQGVAATDLTQKGGDDRNLSMYFVFVDPSLAQGLTPGSARQVLRHPGTKALVYVWGGSRARGTLMKSPYSQKLRTKILRPAATGQFSEDINLESDFRRAFGEEPGYLVAVAVSADSDDTDGKIRAQIERLEVLGAR